MVKVRELLESANPKTSIYSLKIFKTPFFLILFYLHNSYLC